MVVDRGNTVPVTTTPQIQTQIQTAVSQTTQAEPVSWFTVAAVIWCVGMAAMILCSVVSWLRLRSRLKTATRREGNVFESDWVRSPFILGLFRPRIYVPYGMDEEVCRYALTHERFHLRHLDHVVKILAFVLLSAHWFSPLCWIAFRLMGRDMEMRCDEYVLGKLGGAGAYSRACCPSLPIVISRRQVRLPSGKAM